VLENSQTMTSAQDGAGTNDDEQVVWVTATMPRSLAEASLQAAETNDTSRSAVIRAALKRYVLESSRRTTLHPSGDRS